MEQSNAEKTVPEIKVDKKSRVFFLIFALLIAGSVAVTFYRYIVKRDYIVQAQTDCDPETENCFIWKCDPNSLEEGEACTGVPDNDIWYYKIFRRNAKNIPLCDPNDENCAAYVCADNETDCGEELCGAENVPEGEECNDPEKYILENPPEDEECAEDDEECLAAQESVECEEGDEECVAAQENTECAPDDEECATSEAEKLEKNPDNTEVIDENKAPESIDIEKNVIPEGVEPI